MPEQTPLNPSYFQLFQTSIQGITLPEKFAYPMHYEPHDIALVASRELQHYLQTQTAWEHDFGMAPGNDGEIIGKMFGVLVVKNSQGELGYLCAVSGKLAGQNLHEKFVPPVFDILPEDGFFRKGEAVITEINQRVLALENNPDFLAALAQLHDACRQADNELAAIKQRNQQRKEARSEKRKVLDAQSSMEDHDLQLLMLGNESITTNSSN